MLLVDEVEVLLVVDGMDIVVAEEVDSEVDDVDVVEGVDTDVVGSAEVSCDVVAWDVGVASVVDWDVVSGCVSVGVAVAASAAFADVAAAAPAAAAADPEDIFKWQLSPEGSGSE